MFISGDNPVLKIIAVERMHWEGGTFEVAPRSHSALAFRVRGTARICYGDKTVELDAGSILYLPQNLGYRAEYSETELLVFHFITQEDDRHIELYTPKDSAGLYKLFLRAHSLWQNRQPGYPVQVMSQLYAVLGAISESQALSDLPVYFLQAVSHINTNYRHKLNVDQVCREAGIGTTVFRRLFKKHYHKTPVAYITDLRLEYARNLIAGGVPVEEAALESGFSDPKYFARQAQRRLGGFSFVDC